MNFLLRGVVREETSAILRLLRALLSRGHRRTLRRSWRTCRSGSRERSTPCPCRRPRRRALTSRRSGSLRAQGHRKSHLILEAAIVCFKARACASNGRPPLPTPPLPRFQAALQRQCAGLHLSSEEHTRCLAALQAQLQACVAVATREAARPSAPRPPASAPCVVLTRVRRCRRHPPAG